MPDAVPPPNADEACTVVLVPGLGLDARAWHRVRRLLPGPREVVALPAMGTTARGVRDLDVASQAARLRRLLPPARRLVLVGHSASCQIVAEAAAAHPGVCAVVLIAPTTDPTAVTWPHMLARWIRTARHERLWEVGVLAPQYRRTGPVSMVRAMDQVRRHRIDAPMSCLGADVVIIRGEGDRIAPPLWCDHLARLSFGAVTTVRGAAHMVPLTHPEVVAEIIMSSAATGACASSPSTGAVPGHRETTVTAASTHDAGRPSVHGGSR